MPKLKNTLVDACVVIGVNNDTELIHLSGGPQIGGDNTEKYKKYGPYKQHVLGVCTESVAFFPEATTRVEGTMKVPSSFNVKKCWSMFSFNK